MRNKNLTIKNVESISNKFGFIRQEEQFDNYKVASSDLTNYFVIKEGQFAYNPSRINVGSIAYKNIGSESSIVSPLYVSFYTKNLDDYYLWHWFKTSQFKKQRSILSEGGVRDTLSFKQLSEINIATPTINECKLIGECLSKLDTIITIQQDKLNILNNIKQFCLSELFPKKDINNPNIRFKNFNDDWEQCQLNKLCIKLNRKNKNLESKIPLTISAEKGLINQTEFFNKQIASKNLINYYLLKKGEFAYNKSTSLSAPFGTVKRLDRYETGVVSTLYIVFALRDNVNSDYFLSYFNTSLWHKEIQNIATEGARNHGLLNISTTDFFDILLKVPKTMKEQVEIGNFFKSLDSLITLHERTILKGENIMVNNAKEQLFHKYYKDWIALYKEGAIKKVTLNKYIMSHKWLVKLAPKMKVKDLNRKSYQELLNLYSETHERQTTMDFHHQLKGAILDAVDEGLIARDPTRKAIIKGKQPTEKKAKYLNQFQLHTLLKNLDLSSNISWDWFILLVAKTGMRFSEALALTPKDFDFTNQSLSINKTWNYKDNGGFSDTKNKSSIRKIQIDWKTIIQFSELIKDFPENTPIFVKESKKIYNSTINNRLEKLCLKSNIPVISIHGLRHTHASILLFAGVSIASVARRLGHASMSTTQKTYLHIIQELENQDVDLVMRSMANLC